MKSLIPLSVYSKIAHIGLILFLCIDVTLVAKGQDTSQTLVKQADSLYSIGLTFLQTEDYEKALSYFQKAIEKNPRHAEAIFQIGYCKGNLGHYQEEIKTYKQAIHIKPDLAEAHYNLGMA